MTKDQLELIRHIAWSVETLGKEASKALKKMDGVSLESCEALEAALPDWFVESEWKTLGGDAGQANSKHFRVYYQVNERGAVTIQIFCPTFLRGSGLQIHVDQSRVSGSY